MKKIGAILAAGAIAAVSHAQTVVLDPLNGDSLGAYTTTLVLDNSDGAGEGVSFSDSSGALAASYVGTGTSAEQAVLLAPASAFGATFAIGDTLFVDTAVPASSTAEDFGLAIASTATPAAASGANSYNSRPSFDLASISIRPSQTAIRVNTYISGTVTTASYVANNVNPASVSELFITWNSADNFSLGYVTNGIAVTDATISFSSGSTIGSAIGFYGDLRATGTSLGNFSDLSLTVPEPTSLALCGLGAALGLLTWRRRRA